MCHEGGEGGRTQQRSVAGQHDHGVGVVGIVVGQGGETHADRVAGAALHRLLDEVDGLAGQRSLDFFVTRSAAWPTTTTVRLTLHVAQRIEHVEQHRPAAQQVERLGSF